MVKSTHTENRYAVCIGINVYAPSAGLSALRHAEDDARAMDIQLARLGFTDDNRKLLLGEAATLEAINAALEECILDRPHENDLVLFYFAGHGKPLQFSDSNDAGNDGAKGEVFLASYDFDASKIRQSRSFRSQRALGMKRLRETFFEGEGSRKRLFIFDSCYSGDFFGPRYRDDVADPVQGYIKYMLDSKSTGRLALSSCLPVQKAREDATLGHGLFTYHLLKALSGEAPDALRRDGRLTVNSLFDYIADKLPEEQRPVLSAVQQDTFELMCYPRAAKPEQETEETQQERRRIEKDERLRIALADHSAFLQNRMASFVGRRDELKELGQRIQHLLPTGGYLTITGQAGQGKSSIIAKLIEQRGVDQTAFHFIPLNPGPEHQVGLLRNLLARLILKYNLSDLYLASESRAALRDALLALLKEVTAKGGQEVLFIDGLDQLEEEQTGVRDLSFLPSNPPPGIVLVLGTRPNDALRPLELLKPHVTYPLPNLSRQDFDLILQHRGVSLSSELGDRFYEAMQQNALYLDLVAKELAEHDQQAPEELIEQLTENPERLFSLATDRFKRQWGLWRDLIKPILGLLLVVQEPLSKRQMRSILDVDADSLNKGLEHLGGLVIRDEQDRYSLYHLKFREFLQEEPSRPQKQFIFAQEEIEDFHHRVARWCEQSDIINIWKDVPNDATEQARRLYARQHYLTHLYYARQWQALFAVLDAGTFGHAKLEHDPSMRSYTLDLTWGEQAAAWENYSLEQGIDYLPVLWHYSLLRCRLVSRADSYPDEAFETMILLGQSMKAVEIAELLTNPVRRVRVLLLLARLLAERRGQHQEAAQLVKRAMVVASLIERASDKDAALSSLASSLAQEQQWHEAKRIIATIQNSNRKARALSSLASHLAQAGEGEAAKCTWHEAERVIATIQHSYIQAQALSSLASSLAQGQQWHEAERIIASIQDSQTQARALSSLASSLAQEQQWHEAKRIIATIQDSQTQARALSSLASSLAQEQQWHEAKRIIATIQHSQPQVEALSSLASHLAQAGEGEAAKCTWHEAERIIATIQDSQTQAEALSSLASRLAQGQQWHEAERVIATIQRSQTQAWALSSLASRLAQGQQWHEAERVIATIQDSQTQVEALSSLASSLAQGQQWHEAERVIATIQNSYWQAVALSSLASHLAQAGEGEAAKRTWHEAECIIATIQDSYGQARALSSLASSLAQAGEGEAAKRTWHEAERIIASIQDSQTQAWALSSLASRLAQEQQWHEAERIIATIQHSQPQVEALSSLASSLAQAEALSSLASSLAQEQQWHEAERIIATIQHSQPQARALSSLASSLAQAGEGEAAKRTWHEAECIIATIQHYGQAEALSSLASSLAQGQQWHEAERVIATIEWSDRQAEALSSLASSLAQGQQWHEAERVIATIEWSDRQAEALSSLASSLAQGQQWHEAERVIATIEWSDRQAEALSSLASSLAQAGEHEAAKRTWHEAERVIATIQHSDTQARALSSLASSLAQAGEREAAKRTWHEAECIIATIQDSNRQAEALSSLASSLAQAHEWEMLLGRIQRFWKSAKTQQEALSLFPLALNFFSIAPLLGKRFHEAFVWVDTFLRG